MANGSLCRESFLANVLERFGDWYAENRRRNINCELYREIHYSQFERKEA